MSFINNSFLILKGVSNSALYRHGLFFPLRRSIFNYSNTTIKVHFSSRTQASNPRYKNVLKILGIGIGIGGISSGVYLYSIYKKVDNQILNATSSKEYILQEAPPTHTIARSIQNLADRTGIKITLYQFQTCPFCCKVRTFLDYYGFSYDVVEVNSVTHKQTKWTNYRKVPFLVIEQDGEKNFLQLKDSSMIISALQSFIFNKNQGLEDIVRGYPIICSVDEDGKKKMETLNKYSIMGVDIPDDQSKEEMLCEKRWRNWVDDVYVHTLSPNVYRTLNESFQAFNWFSKAGEWEEHFKTWERVLVIYVGSLAMYLIGKRLKKRHSLHDDVRISFYNETKVWLKAVKSRGGMFMGGSEPNLADLGMYGVLTAVEGCDAFQDLLQHTSIQSWYERMKEAVDTHQGVKYLAQRVVNKS